MMMRKIMKNVNPYIIEESHEEQVSIRKPIASPTLILYSRRWVFHADIAIHAKRKTIYKSRIQNKRLAPIVWLDHKSF